MAQVNFQPRRLGHANLFVQDLERSIAFYERVAGIELVRREPAISAAFHSNGNTHHDIGMLQCAPGERIGLGGYVQPSSRRGGVPGLNHVGWELNSEADLVDALSRAEKAGVRIISAANHQITHGVYVADPDGNYHEFYADVVDDWRTIFNLDREDLVSERWDWKNSARLGPCHPPQDERQVAGAIFHPRRITHITLVVDAYEAVFQFLRDVAGLETVASEKGRAALKGKLGNLDLVLVSSEFGLKRGIHGMSFLVEEAESLRASAARARAEGLAVTVHEQAKKSVLLRDPDGLVVEFYAGSPASAALPDPRKAGENEFWAYAA